MLLVYLQEIFLTMRHNKLRTSLTIFGVFWGVLMLVMILGAGKGLENGSRANLPNDDLTSIWFWARNTSLPYKGLAARRRINFEESDLAAIRKNISNIKYLAAMSGKNGVSVTYNNKKSMFTVSGVTGEFFFIRTINEQRSGRRLNLFDESNSRKVALIGSKVKQALFAGNEQVVGKYIAINGIMVKVVGIFHDTGNRGRNSERIYIPMSTYQGTFGTHEKIDQIVVVPKSGVNPFIFEEQVLGLLKERHRVAPEDKRGIGANNLAKLTQNITSMFAALAAFSWFVGIGTLAAGIVGVGNIMIITVKDRTREIGIRKALGATPRSIVTMIVAESVLLTAFAGYLGLVVGVALIEVASWAISKAGSQVQNVFINPEVSLALALQMLCLLIFLGALAGMAPALRAAKISPVAAMREEK